MRIAVISDVHANAEALKAVLAEVEKRPPDAAVFLGDLVMNGPQPLEAFELMRSLNPCIWIKGNTDNWFDEIDGGFVPADEREQHIVALFEYAKKRLQKDKIDFLRALPEKRVLYCGGKRILCVHGSPRRVNEPIGPMTSEKDLEDMVGNMAADILLCGHTHRRFETEVCGKRIINAGAVSLGAGTSFGILEIEEDIASYTHHTVEYDTEAVIKDAEKRGFPGVTAYAMKLRDGVT